MVDSCIISGSKSEILRIPAGYANAILALEPNSKLLSFCTLPLSDVAADDVRFSPNTWPTDE